MSDWGDFTPGPWRYIPPIIKPAGSRRGYIWGEGCDPDIGPGAEYGKGYVLALDGCREADARLISKAYLIPRLEAALGEVWASETTPEEQDDDALVHRHHRAVAAIPALLEELRQP